MLRKENIVSEYLLKGLSPAEDDVPALKSEQKLSPRKQNKTWTWFLFLHEFLLVQKKRNSLGMGYNHR